MIWRMHFKSGKLDGRHNRFKQEPITRHASGSRLKVIMKNDGILYLIAGKESGIKKLTDLYEK